MLCLFRSTPFFAQLHSLHLQRRFLLIYAPLGHIDTMTVRYPCEREGCDKTYTATSALRRLRRHVKNNHRGDTYLCEHVECDKPFITTSYLNEHTRIHNLRFTCLRPYCKDRFATAWDAWKHTWGESHTATAVYICLRHLTCSFAIAKRRFDERGAKAYWLNSHVIPGVATSGAECLRKMVPSYVPPWGGPGCLPLFSYLLRAYAISKY